MSHLISRNIYQVRVNFSPFHCAAPCSLVKEKFRETVFLFQISQSQNRVYLNAGTLMLNINDDDYDKGIKGLGKK